jgi:GNAT superfamily N-acetyltransferase
MSLRIVDPHMDDDFRGWFSVVQAAELYRERGTGEGWQFDEWRARALDEVTPIRLLAWTSGEENVGVAGLHMTTLDNLSSVRCDLYVHPERRRRGYGRALLGAVETYASEHGRSLLTCFATEGSHEVGSGPSRHFAPAMGYELADDSRRFDLEWSSSKTLRNEQAARWRPLANSYELISYRGESPREFLEQRAVLASEMSADSPWANYEPEREVWDAKRVITHEATTASMGRLLFVTVARERSTSTLVAFSELTIFASSPATAYQWDTFVLRAHRGHRLGGLVKLANLDQLEATGLDVRRVTTFNSTINEPMMRVNRELGAHIRGAAPLWRRTLR